MSRHHLFRRSALTFWLVALGAFLAGLAPDQALALRFVAMGDSRGYTTAAPVNNAVLGTVNQQVTALNPSPEFLMFYGDMSYRAKIDGQYTYTSWLNFMRTQPTGLPASLPLYLAIGNHELHEAGGTSVGAEEAVLMRSCQVAYQDFITANLSAQFMPGITNYNDEYKYLAYSFTADSGNSLFVVLDGFYVDPSQSSIPYTASGSLNQAQLTYLQTTLAASTAKTKFVIVHNPAFEPTDQAYHACWTPSMCTFWQIINDQNVTAVFNGHTHLYSRVMINSNFNASNPTFNFTNSIPQIVAGTCGAPISGTGDEPSMPTAPPNWNEQFQFNYAVVDVDNSGLIGKIVVHSYCSDGTSPWSLCDTYTNIPSSPALNDLLLLQNANGQGQ
ncbi:metallophosphoesterase family protein [Desulfovibrio sp. TomC]|uniref:metallophosphoesterase family protein n=1 Tax=Desulfovibrio sp. TomC TaxID=1562888 RepID=UPI0005749FD4|nr:metallophosphoesterase [Desulfovibrio sp. TomC]KHK02517.1 purple acid phosphatase [Desulfovibrio sp. TomC]